MRTLYLILIATGIINFSLANADAPVCATEYFDREVRPSVQQIEDRVEAFKTLMGAVLLKEMQTYWDEYYSETDVKLKDQVRTKAVHFMGHFMFASYQEGKKRSDGIFFELRPEIREQMQPLPEGMIVSYEDFGRARDDRKRLFGEGLPSIRIVLKAGGSLPKSRSFSGRYEVGSGKIRIRVYDPLNLGDYFYLPLGRLIRLEVDGCDVTPSEDLFIHLAD